MKLYLYCILSSIVFGMLGCSADSEIRRTDHEIKNHDISLFVREIMKPSVEKSPHILLMLHGGGPAGVASFDLPVENGSFAAFLVEKDIKVYLIDIRGWGGSTDPEYDTATASINVGHKEAAEDIDVVVNWILERENQDKIALLGWATGGHWGGYYCTQYGEKISHFISLNSLYPIQGTWGLNDAFAHPDDSATFNPDLRGWRIVEEENLTRSWDNSIPIENKQLWRDSLVAKAYREETVRTDISFPDTIRKMKVPAGFREESFNMANGMPYWHSKDIFSKCLVIRGALDFWSRPIDLIGFKKGNPQADTLTIPLGTHMVFLDHLDKGKQQLIDATINFLKQ